MKTKIKKTLQLDNKWVKIMLTVSIVVIVSLSFYPENGFRVNHKSAQKEMRVERVNPEIAYNLDTTMIEAPISAPQPPIQIQIVKEKEDFNWKEMISWIIGGMNGVVLLIMNIRNIKKK